MVNILNEIFFSILFTIRLKSRIFNSIKFCHGSKATFNALLNKNNFCAVGKPSTIKNPEIQPTSDYVLNLVARSLKAAGLKKSAMMSTPSSSWVAWNAGGGSVTVCNDKCCTKYNIYI
jgi:hypothetical protein